jgi:G3E family GTPase
MKLFLLSGFLGSGKTTAIREAALQLIREGRRVALITNDQGTELVDTAWLDQVGTEVWEVMDGCFCCRYDELEKGLGELQALDPEIIFAEAAGTCTDLLATVVKPLEGTRPELEIVLSVFADASMLWPLINGETFFFNEDVRYIYQKQLEEADLIVLNKSDLLSNDQREKLIVFLKEQYPDKVILIQDSTNTDSIQIWLSVLSRLQPPGSRRSLEIDYDRYAHGERVLGWLDERLQIHSQDGSACEAAHHLVREIQRRVHKAGIPIGHLKFLVDNGQEAKKYSYTTISGSGAFPEATPAPCNHVDILVNARVQADPILLDDLVKASISAMRDKYAVQVTIKASQAFQPGYPKPVHRM